MTMEPFTIHCETCRAKLRVRDERVLGQIHECPRCGSMVHIALPGAMAAAMPAGLLQETLTIPAAEVVAASSPVPAPPPIAESLAATAGPRIVFWAAGGAALFIAGGIVAAIALSGSDDEVAVAPTAPVAEQLAALEAPPLPAETLEESKPVASEVVAAPIAETEVAPPAEPEVVAPVAEIETPPAVRPSPASPVVVESPQPVRTLKLDPVPAKKASMGELVEGFATPEYEAAVEEEVVAPEAKTQVAAARGRVTNVRDQLALPIAAMDIDAMPLSSFVEMISEMAAVPIAVDPNVLRSVGASPRTPVSMQTRDETIESLLTKTLAAHRLKWEERDGELVVLRAN